MITDDTTSTPEKEEQSDAATPCVASASSESPFESLLWELGTEVVASVGSLLARKYSSERLDGKPKSS